MDQKIININYYRSLSTAAEIENYVKTQLPNIPVYCLRPDSLKTSASFFKDYFNFQNHFSRILYSVKSNPDIEVIQGLQQHGIKDFDVASLNEVKLIDKTFGSKAKMFFMHPIKPYEAIVESYNKFGIKDYSLDSFDELEKILRATNNASDLNLNVRLAVPSSNSAIELSSKFGILPSESISLIRKTRSVAKKLGICFHVGSQCMDPMEYRKAIMIACDVIEKSGVKLDILDIGGGFPAIYPTLNPPKLSSYFNEIHDAIKSSNLDNDCEIWCEPGRALVAESCSLVVRVEARKDNMLYINDGIYGGLFDAGLLEFTYPLRPIRVTESAPLQIENLEAFGFYGPTCDSLDCMNGPFYLPCNIKDGDYIEIGQLGSYSKTMRTNFNGFADFTQIEVKDKPIITIFDEYEQLLDNAKI